MLRKLMKIDEKKEEKWFYWLRVDLMKMDKIGLELVKNMRRFEKKNVVHDHVIYGLLTWSNKLKNWIPFDT